MAKVVVLGAGVAGHTAASFLKKKLGKHHEVIVVTPNSYYQWIPSNIWVGVGQMTIDDVRFELKKVYNRWGIVLKQAKALGNPSGRRCGNPERLCDDRVYRQCTERSDRKSGL